MQRREHLLVVSLYKEDASGAGRWETVGGADLVLLGDAGWEVVSVVPMKRTLEIYPANPLPVQRTTEAVTIGILHGSEKCTELHVYLKRAIN